MKQFLDDVLAAVRVAAVLLAVLVVCQGILVMAGAR